MKSANVARDPGQPLRRRARDPAATPQVDGGRAPADAVARVGGRPHSGRGSAWVTAGATLAVALAFRPLRSLVQAGVDRRFSRARYDALRQVEAFEADVRDGRRAPEEIDGVLAQALRDPLAELLFWLPASETYTDSSGEIVGTLPDDGRGRSDSTTALSNGSSRSACRSAACSARSRTRPGSSLLP